MIYLKVQKNACPIAAPHIPPLHDKLDTDDPVSQSQSLCIEAGGGYAYCPVS